MSSMCNCPGLSGMRLSTAPPCTFSSAQYASYVSHWTSSYHRLQVVPSLAVSTYPHRPGACVLWRDAQLHPNHTENSTADLRRSPRESALFLFVNPRSCRHHLDHDHSSLVQLGAQARVQYYLDIVRVCLQHDLVVTVPIFNEHHPPCKLFIQERGRFVPSI
jgi:hypothetical protein